jgi:hypothetical protein
MPSSGRDSSCVTPPFAERERLVDNHLAIDHEMLLAQL